MEFEEERRSLRLGHSPRLHCKEKQSRLRMTGRAFWCALLQAHDAVGEMGMEVYYGLKGKSC